MKRKSYIAILLLCIYGYSQWHGLIHIADYIIDYQTYKNEKCENKDRPELACKGTCQLAKLLSSPEKSAPELGTIPVFSSLSILIATPRLDIPLFIAKSSQFPELKLLPTKLFQKLELPPPKIETAV